MRRLGAVLVIAFMVLGVSARSVWSGGVVWGDGTPAGDPTDAYWMPDGSTPTGALVPDVAIGGTLYTDQVRSASWSLGISGFLADLSPNTASLEMVGQVVGVPGDEVVITTALGVQWAGRLDSLTETRDTAGVYWTTVTATDRLGALGAARLVDFDHETLYDTQPLDVIAEGMAADVGIVLDVVDDSSGLPTITSSNIDPYTGEVLSYINSMAKSSNAMLAMTRDGRISAVVRESVTPSSVLTLSGVNAPVTWTKQTTIDVDVNIWYALTGGNPDAVAGRDDDDIKVYGERGYTARDFTLGSNPLTDWIAYGGSQRLIVSSGEMVVTSWTQDDLILLDPFQWVAESGTAWQVMSVTHNVSPFDWRVTITADNLLDLL